MTRRRLMAILVLAPLLFVALIGGSSWLLGSSVRFDVTENQLYTLSSGTHQILGSLDEPVTLTVYFSDEATRDLPSLRFFADRVRDLIEEMVLASDGQLVVDWVDPIPFSQAEDEALLAGLTGLAIGPQDTNVYFGIRATAEGGQTQSIPLISPQREPLLEFMLIQTIERVQRDTQPRLGLISDLPIQSGLIYEQLSARFELIEHPATAEQLASELDALMIAQPTEMTPSLVSDVLEFIQNGGGLLLAVDPFVQSVGRPGPPAAELSAVFEALGVSIDLTHFVNDPLLGLEVNLSPESSPVRHPAILGIDGEHLSREDVVTTELDIVHVATAGHWQANSETAPFFEPLMWSSERSARLPTTRLETDISSEERVTQLSQETPLQGERSVVAARITGRVNAIVIGDVDFLDDRYWVARQQFLGTELTEAFASNGAFVLNAVDHLIGDERLIGIRSRDVAFRPFTLVDELRRLAEARLLATENRLSSALEEADQALTALRAEAPDAMTDAQRQELERFVERRMRLRQELRQVRRELDQDIRSLEQRIIWINLLFMPLVVVVWMLMRRWPKARRS